VPALPPADADRLAARLDLDVDEIGICHACLSFVSFAIDDGDEREVRRWTSRMAPDLWEEGLEQPVRQALEAARGRGVPGAAAALMDVRRAGPRSGVVKAIVRRLAADLSARSKERLAQFGFEPRPPPGRRD
jgi:hypothetical protein